MNALEVLRHNLKQTGGMLDVYLGDLSDADLVVRPVPGANHIAWQLGHLISTECKLAANLPEAAFPELPAGFAERHSNANAASESPAGLHTKGEYLDLFKKVRTATLTVLGKLTEADLDRPTTGPMARLAPTLGTLFALAASHTLMHSGQFSVVRRKLGKPVLF